MWKRDKSYYVILQKKNMFAFRALKELVNKIN